MVIDKIGFNGPFWLVFKLVILKKKTFQNTPKVVKQKVQARQATSSWQCLRSILAKQGVRGLFVGYWTTVMRDVSSFYCPWLPHCETIEVGTGQAHG